MSNSPPRAVNGKDFKGGGSKYACLRNSACGSFTFTVVLHGKVGSGSFLLIPLVPIPKSEIVWLDWCHCRTTVWGCFVFSYCVLRLMRKKCSVECWMMWIRVYVDVLGVRGQWRRIQLGAFSALSYRPLANINPGDDRHEAWSARIEGYLAFAKPTVAYLINTYFLIHKLLSLDLFQVLQRLLRFTKWLATVILLIVLYIWKCTLSSKTASAIYTFVLSWSMNLAVSTISSTL